MGHYIVNIRLSFTTASVVCVLDTVRRRDIPYIAQQIRHCIELHFVVVFEVDHFLCSVFVRPFSSYNCELLPQISTHSTSPLLQPSNYLVSAFFIFFGFTLLVRLSRRLPLTLACVLTWEYELISEPWDKDEISIAD